MNRCDFDFIRLNASSPRIFAKEVVDKVKELDEEKKKTEKAFHDFLPPSVVKDIKNKKVNRGFS